jgi:hypothetical protein
MTNLNAETSPGSGNRATFSNAISNGARLSGESRTALTGSRNVISFCVCVNIAALFLHRGGDGQHLYC